MRWICAAASASTSPASSLPVERRTREVIELDPKLVRGSRVRLEELGTLAEEAQEFRQAG